MRWHLAQLLPRLDLSPVERRAAVTILTGFLSDRSSIVQAFSLQAMFDLSAPDPELRAQVLPVIEAAAAAPGASPAVNSRVRKLLQAQGPARRRPQR